MLIQRTPDADFGGPVTTASFVSSTTAASMRTRLAVVSMCLPAAPLPAPLTPET
jgi:hypothetical protein